MVVYGGSSAAVMAAVQAARMGRSVVVVSPDIHLGGLSSGGLGWTDTGSKQVIGGLAREFYHRVWKHYERPDAWRWQPRSAYGDRGQGTPAVDGAARTMWIFEPHVAEGIFEALVAEHGVEVVRDEWLDREGGVRTSETGIESITTLSGRTYGGKMFVDATYEGDLMAAAGVAYHVGREANAVYGEEHNGVQVGVLHHRHHFGTVPRPISPYRIPDDPTSGLLPRISAEPPGEFGAGDHRVQAYCFRGCFTTAAANRVPFPRPAGYDAGQYELLLRIFSAGWREFFAKFEPIPNAKTDTNNHGPFSFDNIGCSDDYPEASYERRREIVAEHRGYQQGLLWFVANDPRVPADVREELARWGLAADEFTDNGNWPHQIYVREARRMIGSFVMTEGELRGRRPVPDPIGMGSYTIDSHNVQRYVTPQGFVQNEGDIGVPAGGPYGIASGAVVPRRRECDNLVVPVCVSASHIAYGSIRMEPVFMILGQSAATMACLAIEAGCAVQDVPYARLRDRLLADRQVLAAPTPATGARPDGGSADIPPEGPVDVILDTDIGNDIDDALALALLHALEARDECRLLAVTITKDHPLAASFADAVDEFYGRGDVPIGVVRDGPTPEPGPHLEVATVEDEGVLRYPHDLRDGAAAPEAVSLLRRVLAGRPDGSVVVIQIGFSTNLARLLDSPGDAASPLTGRDLVARKVRLASVMAGAFQPVDGDHRFREYNVVTDLPAARKLASDWPTPILWSGYEVGLAVTYPARSIEEDFRWARHHPVAEAYRRHQQMPYERPCWDLTSVIAAVRPNHGRFTLSPPGRVRVADDGSTAFEEVAAGPHRLLMVDAVQASRLREEFAELCSMPRRRP